MLSDEEGVLGLPLKIVVLTIIGMAGLAFMLAGMANWAGMMPKTMYANVLSSSILNASAGELSDQIVVQVLDVDSNPVEGATVAVYGLGLMGSAKTGSDGNATINGLDGRLDMEGSEGYLLLVVKASGYQDYRDEYGIKVIR
jgi:hypothetical protein